MKDAYLDNNRWFSAVLLCMYWRIIRWVVLYFESCMAPLKLTSMIAIINTTNMIFECYAFGVQRFILDDLFPSHSYIIPQFGNHQIDFVPKIN